MRLNGVRSESFDFDRKFLYLILYSEKSSLERSQKGEESLVLRFSYQVFRDVLGGTTEGVGIGTCHKVNVKDRYDQRNKKKFVLCMGERSPGDVNVWDGGEWWDGGGSDLKSRKVSRSRERSFNGRVTGGQGRKE